MREKWPNATTTSGYGNRDPYCVGAAFCRVVYDTPSHWFPSDATMAAAMLRANPKVTEAAKRAREIITANTGQKFDEAWRILEETLVEGLEP